MTQPKNSREFTDLLTKAAREVAEAGDPLDSESVLARVQVTSAMPLKRIVVGSLPGPVAPPDGFSYPLVPPRKPTPARVNKIIQDLGSTRAQVRRAAASLLGGMMESPGVVDAVRHATSDPDPDVAGTALLDLALATTTPPSELLDKARNLVELARKTPGGTDASDVAWEGASNGLFAVLVASARSGDRGSIGELRGFVVGLPTQMTVRYSNVPSRRRASLLAAIEALDHAPSGAGPDED